MTEPRAAINERRLLDDIIDPENVPVVGFIATMTYENNEASELSTCTAGCPARDRPFLVRGGNSYGYLKSLPVIRRPNARSTCCKSQVARVAPIRQ